MKSIQNALMLFSSSLLMVVVLALIVTFPVQLLWNGCLVEAIDGINPIGFWQALGISILTSLLFKSTTTSKHK